MVPLLITLSSLATAGGLTAADWEALDDEGRARHVAKKVDHDYVRLGPPKAMDAIFTGAHRIERLCVIGVQVGTLLESKKLVGAGPSTETHSIVSFSQEGLSAWADLFHDLLVEELSARPDLEVVGVQEVSAAPMYTEHGKGERGPGWASETQYWRTLAYDSQGFPLEGNLITRAAWMNELGAAVDCDAFVHGNVLLTFAQGKADTLDGADGRWLDGTLRATFHTYIVRDHYLAAAEAGGHFTPPKFAPKVNPWVSIGPKAPLEFSAFVASEAPDAVLLEHYATPIEEAFKANAAMNALALQLAYPVAP